MADPTTAVLDVVDLTVRFPGTPASVMDGVCFSVGRGRRPEPPGGDRRAGLAFRACPVVVLAAPVAPDRLVVKAAWSEGRLVAASRDADGLLRAAADPRGMRGYAAGR